MLERFRADPMVSSFQGSLDDKATTEQLEHVATLIPDEWLAPSAMGSPDQCVAAIRGQFALGADGVILHGVAPVDLVPSSTRTRRTLCNFSRWLSSGPPGKRKVGPMADEPEYPVTREHLDAFVEKLEDWAENLSVGEQAMLQVILARAGAEESEVEGFAFGGGAFGGQSFGILAPMIGGLNVRAPGGLNCTGWVKGTTMWSRSGDT